jgi:flagellar basal body-associated protein FliL
MLPRIKRERREMVNEVNKIIKNTLISRGGVTLPSVGTLRLVRKGAQPISKGVSTPEYAIIFSSSEDTLSLIDAIASVASIPYVDAEDIYLRWLDKSRNDGRVVIEGVGTICDKSFKAEDAMISQLNPFRGNTLTLSYRRSSKHWIIYTAASIVVLLAVGACLIFMGNKSSNDNTEHSTESNTQLTANNQKIVASEDVTITLPTDISTNVVDNHAEDSDNVEIADVPYSSEASEPMEVIEPIEPIVVRPWHEATDIKHYVIVGSYKRRSNANGAIADIEAMTEVELECQAIKRGNMYSVAIFGGNDITSCERFVSQHKELFPQAWIYSVETE